MSQTTLTIPIYLGDSDTVISGEHYWYGYQTTKINALKASVEQEDGEDCGVMTLKVCFSSKQKEVSKHTGHYQADPSRSSHSRVPRTHLL